MLGQKMVDGQPFGTVVVVLLLWEMCIFDQLRRAVKLVDVPDIWQLDFWCVLGPVRATGDKQLWPRRGEGRNFSIVGVVPGAFMDRQSTFAFAASVVVGSYHHNRC